jgi:hypothetical protein
MSLSSYTLRMVCLALVVSWPTVVTAQQPTPVTYGDGRRAQATRAELEASLLEIDKIVSSPGYSSRLRENRRREAELIRERLEEGDLQVGDQIELNVLGEERFSGTFLIGAGRVLSLPGMPEIPLRGVLRAETQEYLTEQLRRQLRDPRVQVRTNIRLTFTGAVARTGFFQVPADIMATDAVMVAAGGFAGGGDPNRMLIRRQGREIWGKEAFQDAILRGLTLDQMNLRTNDEIVVQARPRAPLGIILGGLSAASSLIYLMFRIL